ncbi:MAG: RHS repeat-associated core domain-containing protein [Muribaculaceae bacterium]|nr:RHS repeat-associated core domain-containing protein [Muribaculaceae bacterium]
MKQPILYIDFPITKVPKHKGLTSIVGSADTGISPAFGTVDDLTLRYSGNRLTKVDDAGSGTYYTGAPDFYDTRYFNIEYEYDANGNMTADKNRGITGVVYNSLNLPVRIEVGGDTFVENLYDADGSLRQRRLRQKAEGIPTIGGFFPADSIDSEGYYIRVTDYCGPWEYVNGKLSTIRIPGGYIECDSVYFNIFDHQGNIRQIWNATTAKTVQDNHYYPYGALLGESASTEYIKAVARGNRHPVSTNPYKYSAKEWQPAFGLNLYDFIARQYDPILCRFTSPDPLNGKYPYLSPYLYCAANPINMSDPSGLAAIYNSSGEHIGNTKEGFTGQIYIYDGSEEIDFSKYYEYQLSSLNIYIRKYDDVANLLSSSAKTAIWNDIIFHFEGMNIFGEIFSMDRIEWGGIKYRPKNNVNVTWETVFSLACGIQLLRPRIYGTGNFTKIYEATVENIASSVLVHEWYSHGIMNYCDMDKTHRFAYQNVIRYEPLWNVTTDKYKRAVLFEFISYTFSETGFTSLLNSFMEHIFNYLKKHVQ